MSSRWSGEANPPVGPDPVRGTPTRATLLCGCGVWSRPPRLAGLRQHFMRSAHERHVPPRRHPPHDGDEAPEPLGLDLLGDVIFDRTAGVPSRTEYLNVYASFEGTPRPGRASPGSHLGLAGEPDDDVGREGRARRPLRAGQPPPRESGTVVAPQHTLRNASCRSASAGARAPHRGGLAIRSSTRSVKIRGVG